MCKIVELHPRKDVEESEDPHMSGEAVCMNCGHEWVAVGPVGQCYLLCPKCKTHRGVYSGGCLPPEGSELWECLCGNHALYATPNGLYCCNCGERQQPYD